MVHFSESGYWMKPSCPKMDQSGFWRFTVQAKCIGNSAKYFFLFCIWYAFASLALELIYFCLYPVNYIFFFSTFTHI